MDLVLFLLIGSLQQSCDADHLSVLISDPGKLRPRGFNQLLKAKLLNKMKAQTKTLSV